MKERRRASARRNSRQAAKRQHARAFGALAPSITTLCFKQFVSKGGGTDICHFFGREAGRRPTGATGGLRSGTAPAAGPCSKFEETSSSLSLTISHTHRTCRTDQAEPDLRAISSCRRTLHRSTRSNPGRFGSVR